jgi:hypothetical protein
MQRDEAVHEALVAGSSDDGSDGTRTRDLRRDRPVRGSQGEQRRTRHRAVHAIVRARSSSILMIEPSRPRRLLPDCCPRFPSTSGSRRRRFLSRRRRLHARVRSRMRRRQRAHAWSGRSSARLCACCAFQQSAGGPSEAVTEGRLRSSRPRTTLRLSQLRLDEAAADRVASEVDAVAHAELAEDVGTVGLDGFDAEDKRGCNIV